ncbi:Glycosyl transferases group 1 [[Lactobacillus] rogosae]|nr:Glycosyl transferases group 1 [Lactobacillus rogosae]
MKINILFQLNNNPSGGGNQFLKALKKTLIKKNMYAEMEDSDVVICNSHQYVKDVIKMKKKYPDKIFIHRIDGPMRLYNKMSDKRDYVVNVVNKTIADGTVFQSKFSQRENYRLGLKKNKFETIIYNTPDETIFYPPKLKDGLKSKIKLVATSWSGNINKGFDTYNYLDQNLDFSRYSMSFVGNSPIKYKNIKMYDPKSSEELAEFLRKQDIYISASKKEPCSNAILEAMNCGLPVVIRNDGGNPELVKNAGCLFNSEEDIIQCIEKVSEDYNDYKNSIVFTSFDKKADEYIEFCSKVYNATKKGEYVTRKLTWINELKIYFALIRWKLSVKLGND